MKNIILILIGFGTTWFVVRKYLRWREIQKNELALKTPFWRYLFNATDNPKVFKEPYTGKVYPKF